MTNSRTAIGICCLTCLWFIPTLLSGCQTTGGATAAQGPHAERVIPFQPVVAKSGLHLDQGRYPDLFTPDSYACWAGIDGNAPASERTEAMAQALGDRYAVIECRLESAFADMDKAYEVVGLRGVDAYLLTDSGKMIRPTKLDPGQALDEVPVGALRQFGRTNVIVFPVGQLMMTVSGANPVPPTLRLVLEGYDSTFYFSWSTFVPPPNPESYPELKSRLRGTQRNLQAAGKRFIRISHRFD